MQNKNKNFTILYKMENNKHSLEQLSENLWRFGKEKVLEVLREQKIDFRIVREDKSHYVITCDLKFDRLNLEFDNNYLTKAKIG